MKKIVLSCLIIVLVISSIVLPDGCRRKPKDKDRIVIGLAVPSLSHPFFIYLKKNITDEAEKLGVDIIAADAEDVAARQMSIVEDFIVRGVDGVLISPIGADSLVPAVKSLNAAGIPVATVDRKVNGGDVLVHVGADNVEGGRVAARYIIARLGPDAGVIQIEGTPGASPAIDRKKGFEEEIAKTGLKIVASQTADFNRAKGMSVMENLIQANRDFQAVYAANDEMALGAAEALQARGMSTAEIILIGYDAIPDALVYIKDGKLNATIEQFPGKQARQALRILVEYIRDSKIPPASEIYIKPLAIDADNLDQAERKLE
ncbi:MAG: substrate-binding domain-containing protein [Sedimentisphaerales bacterium]|nr:substrate-binding domain-containing protein [Sedimentisphaerales bacterium]